MIEKHSAALALNTLFLGVLIFGIIGCFYLVF